MHYENGFIKDQNNILEAKDIFSPDTVKYHIEGIKKPKIAMCGMSIEASVFSAHRSGKDEFKIQEGDELLNIYSFFDKNSCDENSLYNCAKWIPLTRARSLPGGVVKSEFYNWFKNYLLNNLKECINTYGPLDGILWDIHGAMSVEGMQDAEYDLTKAVRDLVGPNTFISATMDLHGNVSQRLVKQLDLITCYKMAPHEDEQNTKKRAVYNMLKILKGPNGSKIKERKPYIAYKPVKVLLPGEKTSTRIQPAKSLYQETIELEKKDDIIDASIYIGYAWADEPRAMGSVVVTSYNQELAERMCEKLAKQFWDERKNFTFVADALPLNQCLSSVLQYYSDEKTFTDPKFRPFIISDSGDNPTAGGTGDTTWAVNRMSEYYQGKASEEIKQKEFTRNLTELKCLCSSIFDKTVVDEAFKIGEGGLITAKIGAKVDRFTDIPIDTKNALIMKCATTKEYKHVLLRIFISDNSSEIQAQGDKTGFLDIIVTDKRKPFHTNNDYNEMGVYPECYHILINKIGYLEPELFDMAKQWKLGLTPGGVDQDLKRLGHKNLMPGVYPLT